MTCSAHSRAHGCLQTSVLEPVVFAETAILRFRIGQTMYPLILFTAAQQLHPLISNCNHVLMYTVAVCVTILFLCCRFLLDDKSCNCKSSQTQTSGSDDQSTQCDLDCDYSKGTVAISRKERHHETCVKKEHVEKSKDDAGDVDKHLSADENGEVTCTESCSTADRSRGVRLVLTDVPNENSPPTLDATIQGEVVQQDLKSECDCMWVDHSPKNKQSNRNTQQLKGGKSVGKKACKMWAKKASKCRCRLQKISPEDFAMCIRSLQTECTQKRQDCKRKLNSDAESDSEKYSFSFTDLHVGPNMYMTYVSRPSINALPIRRDMSSELARLSTFGLPVSHTWLSRLPSSGVWILHLAQAGFYLAQVENSDSALRCAFCNVVVHDISQFTHEQPIDVHRRLAPNCPLMTAKDATNLSLAQTGETSGQAFVQAMFDPARKSPVSPPHTTESHRRSSSISEGASAQYRLPPPRQLAEQRLTTAAASQASQTSARHQPLSLPANVNMHQSSPPSLQHTSSAPASAGRSREQPAAHMSTYVSTQVMATNQASLPASPPTFTAQVTPAQNAPPQTPLAQSAPPEPSVHMPMAQSAQVQPSALNTITQTSSPPSQSHLSAHTAPPPTGNSTHVQPHQSQAPNQASTSPQNESSCSENPSSTSNPPRQVVTYAQLGIYTQQPKRPDMVVQSTRCGTFTGWPHMRTHTPGEMAEAGFYYTGHIDLARCFYCKGGLKSWAGHLRPWVEHARFFPECPYVNQVKGRSYIEAVQALHTESEAVSEQQVEAEMARRNKTTHVQQNAETATECGATWGDEGGAVGGAVGEASIVEDFQRNAEPEDITKRVEELENTIQEAKEERICKICQSNEVNILFLPCGHLVACAHCAPALRTCAVCRQHVKGRVRVYMNEEEP